MSKCSKNISWGWLLRKIQKAQSAVENCWNVFVVGTDGLQISRWTELWEEKLMWLNDIDYNWNWSIKQRSHPILISWMSATAGISFCLVSCTIYASQTMIWFISYNDLGCWQLDKRHDRSESCVWTDTLYISTGCCRSCYDWCCLTACSFQCVTVWE